MSGELQRTTSMASTSPTEGSRNLGNGRHSPTSPLKLFGQARKHINHIFVEIGNYIDASNKFVNCEHVRLFELASLKRKIREHLSSGDNNQATEQGIVVPEQKADIQQYTQKVARICEMLNRDRMKVAFFGR